MPRTDPNCIWLNSHERQHLILKKVFEFLPENERHIWEKINNFKQVDKLQSRPERRTSLDKCISKISADYKNDQIRTIQDLTEFWIQIVAQNSFFTELKIDWLGSINLIIHIKRIRTLMKHRDLRNDSDFWNSLRYPSFYHNYSFRLEIKVSLPMCINVPMIP